MIENIDHNKLLKKIVKERLKPFGIFQKGQSRTFLYDKGWYTIIIEFQPSSFSKGTFLNVGIDFNFYPRDYFTFNFGYRENGFEQFNSEKQFTKLCNKLCELAVKKVKELDIKFLNLSIALNTLNTENSSDTWMLFDKAILNVLNDNYEQAKKILNEIQERECEYDYEFERKETVNKLLLNSNATDDLLRNVETLIIQTRDLKKLPALTSLQLQQMNNKQ